MERLDHLRPRPGKENPVWYAHLERQEMEDYAFMISNGESHERALERVGLTQDAWQKRMERAS